MRFHFILALLGAMLVGCSGVPRGEMRPLARKGQPAEPLDPALHLDHVPIAVRSLDDAVRGYERLGFRIKHGRLHDNGIINAFTKFEDASYLELITAPAAVDRQTERLLAFLQRREGGRALSLRADSLARLATRFDEAGLPTSFTAYGRAFNILSFGESAIAPVFLIEYPVPVRDSAHLLDHPNTATGIMAAWVGDGLFSALEEVPYAFRPSNASTIPLAGGTIRRAGGPDGPPDAPDGALVAGVTLRVRSADAARRAVLAGTGRSLPVIDDGRARRVIVPAELANGMWIEFVEEVRTFQRTCTGTHVQVSGTPPVRTNPSLRSPAAAGVNSKSWISPGEKRSRAGRKVARCGGRSAPSFATARHWTGSSPLSRARSMPVSVMMLMTRNR
jgi:hypothetical protein